MTEPRPVPFLAYWLLLVLLIAWNGWVSHVEHARIARECSAEDKP